MKTKLCPLHDIEMQERTSKFGVFFSHSKDNKGIDWCNGRLGYKSEQIKNAYGKQG